MGILDAMICKTVDVVVVVVVVVAVVNFRGHEDTLQHIKLNAHHILCTPTSILESDCGPWEYTQIIFRASKNISIGVIK